MSSLMQASGLTISTIPGCKLYALGNTPSANSLTISIKTSLDNDPTPTEPLFTSVRTAVASGASYSGRHIVAPLSLTIASGNKVGFVNDATGRLWVLLFDDDGTFRLAVTNRFSGTVLYPLADHGIATALSETETGAGAMDFAGDIYAAQHIVNKPYRIVGYVQWIKLTTAGSWNLDATSTQLYHAGMPKPGDELTRVSDADIINSSGTTLVPYDDTVPQNTEGVQIKSLTNPAADSSNALRTVADFDCSYSVASRVILSVFTDSSASALKSKWGYVSVAGGPLQMRLEHLKRSVSGEVISWRVGGDTAGTVTINGVSAGRKLGGALEANFLVSEIMA